MEPISPLWPPSTRPGGESDRALCGQLLRHNFAGLHFLRRLFLQHGQPDFSGRWWYVGMAQRLRVISSISATSVTSTGATISWTTNQFSSSPGGLRHHDQLWNRVIEFHLRAEPFDHPDQPDLQHAISLQGQFDGHERVHREFGRQHVHHRLVWFFLGSHIGRAF